MTASGPVISRLRTIRSLSDGSGDSASCAYRDGRVFGCTSIAASLSEHIDTEVARFDLLKFHRGIGMQTIKRSISHRNIQAQRYTVGCAAGEVHSIRMELEEWV